MNNQLIKRFIKMFGCDTARISRPCGKMFLIIGWNRNTKDDPGQWLKDGEPFNFDYVKEKVIASGETEAELIESAKEYRRLSKMTWTDYFRQHSANLESSREASVLPAPQGCDSADLCRAFQMPVFSPASERRGVYHL